MERPPVGHPQSGRLNSAAAMPIYEYRCENGHHFDVMQKMTDGPVTECEVCGAPVQRVFHPVAVHFKGSGFYNTDYGTAKRKRETAASAESGADKHDAKQAEKKSESSSSSSTSSSSSSSSSSDS
jgi:putative FmdB family regulatory protein